MPRYFFHICDDKGAIPDTEGLLLPNQEAAKREAEHSVRDLVAADIRYGRPVDDGRIEVMSDDGDLIAVYPFRDLLL
jgi:hypothetical protein